MTELGTLGMAANWTNTCAGSLFSLGTGVVNLGVIAFTTDGVGFIFISSAGVGSSFMGVLKYCLSAAH